MNKQKFCKKRGRWVFDSEEHGLVEAKFLSPGRYEIWTEAREGTAFMIGHIKIEGSPGGVKLYEAYRTNLELNQLGELARLKHD